jgi:plasmid stabilization system protein ParE
MGRIVPETNDETIREHLVFSYRLVYRIEAERILVVAVIHDKRLLEAVSGRL